MNKLLKSRPEARLGWTRGVREREAEITLHYDVATTSRRLGCAPATAAHRLHYAPVKRDTASTLHPLFSRFFTPVFYELNERRSQNNRSLSLFLSLFTCPYLEHGVSSYSKEGMRFMRQDLVRFHILREHKGENKFFGDSPKHRQFANSMLIDATISKIAIFNTILKDLIHPDNGGCRTCISIH